MSMFLKPDANGSEPENKKSNRFSRSRKLKHGAYATVVTCVFIAVVVLFNIAATALAERFPLSLDLTAGGDFTINEKNADFIKNLSRDDLDVQIVVCADETAYVNGQFAYDNYYDPSNGQYFVQNDHLLKEYTRLNSAIHLKYISPSDPDFTTYKSMCPDETFIDGDLLLTVSFTMDGETVERWRHLESEDVFEVSYDVNDEMSYMYAQYGMMTLMSNNIETQVTSALASLTSDKIYQVAVVTHNDGTSPAELVSLMKQNNYQFTEIDNLNEKELPEDADIVIVAKPVHDYTEAELKILDDYLDNGGKYGKTLFYIADATQPDLPNLNDFLSEWGFSVLPQTLVVESNSQNATAYYFKLGEEENDYTGDLTAAGYSFYSVYDVAIQLKKPNGTRENETLISYADTAKAMPVDTENFTDYSQSLADGPFVGLGLCRITPAVITDLTDVSRSYVCVCSSASFVELGSESAKIGNLYAIMNTFDTLMGKEDTGVQFDSRKFTQDRFDAMPSKARTAAVTVALIIVVLAPLVIVAVVLRRKRQRRNSK